MKFTELQRKKIGAILAFHTYPKEQFGFFTMNDLINLIESLLTEATLSAGEMPPRKMSAIKDPKTGELMSRQQLFYHKVATGSPFETKSGETVVINDDITVTVLGVTGGVIKVGFTAPKDVSIHREEIYNRIQGEKKRDVSN